MREKEKKNHGRTETRILFHFFMFSTLVNGTMSHRAQSQSHSREMETSQGKGQKFQLTDTDPMCNGKVIVCTGFDKMRHWIFDDGGVEEGEGAGRSIRFKLGERFAFRKRLQFALLPIMYKMGVMTTLLTGLVVLVLKGLTIGVILLIFAFGNHFSKLHKNSHSHSPQSIHVHVHSQDGHKVSSYPSVIGPWDRVADELHPDAYLGDDELESYRRRLIQNSAAMLKVKPMLQY